MIFVFDLLFLIDSFFVYVGKCSYGGFSDVYWGFFVIGGINKEILDFGFFIYYYFYIEVGWVVV